MEVTVVVEMVEMRDGDSGRWPDNRGKSQGANREKVMG